MNFLDHIDINPLIMLEKGKIYPFVEMANVACYSREPHKYEMKTFSSGVRFEKGDTIVARIEPCLQNGKGFRATQIGFGSTEFLVFRPKDNTIDSTYLYYFMQTDYIRKLMIGSMTGATGRQRVNNDIFKTLNVNIPSIENQIHIADILSAYDDLIDNNQKQIRLLEEAAQRLYKEWFVDLRFPGYENVNIVNGVPEGWERQNLYQIASITMGQSPKSEYYNSNGQGLPFHQGVTNYGNRFVVNQTYSTIYRRIAEAGSILFSVRAPVGRLNIAKEKIAIGRGLAAINSKNGQQSFLYYLLKERFYKDNLIGNGAIYASINKDDLSAQVFLLPNLQLVNKFNEIAAFFDTKISVLDSQLNLLQQARDRLLPKLMSGEIEV